MKRALSVSKEARFFVADALGTPGQRRSLDVLVKREHLVTPWSELVQRSLVVASETIGAAGVRPNELAAVMLIGGTTFVPMVREAVSQSLPAPLDLEADPQTAVARGAAILSVMPRLLLD